MLTGIAGSHHRLTNRTTLPDSRGGEAGETEALLIRASRACAIDIRQENLWLIKDGPLQAGFIQLWAPRFTDFFLLGVYEFCVISCLGNRRKCISARMKISAAEF